MTDTYDVPEKDQLLVLARKIEAGDPDILDADYHDYSSEIALALLELKEGAPLDEDKLSQLYDDWEEEDFPMEDDDYDAEQEGGPETPVPTLAPEDDPDLEE